MDRRQAFGIGVAGHHNVRLLGQQGLEGVEELLLRSVLVGEKLHIVNEQQVQRVVTLLEFIKRFALIGFNHIRDKLFGMDVENFCARVVQQQLVADGMNQMGFAQTHPAIDEQRVVQLADAAGHVHGGGAAHAVG